MTKGKNENNNNITWELFFKKLLQNIDAPVMVADPDGNVVFANKKYLKLFGFSEEDIIGKRWIEEIIPESKREAVRRIIDDIKKSETLSRFDAPVIKAEGVEKYLRWVGIPLSEKETFLYMFVGRETELSEDADVKVHSSSPEKISTVHEEIVNVIFEASRVSEPDTAEHAARVVSFATALAEKMNIGKERIEGLKVACLLHDLGKLAVDEKILYKKGKLDKDEFEQIKKHPHLGSKVASLVYFLRDIIPIMANHHENYDGSGYPSGIKGEDIPVEARILSVADIYEALTADRPYRKGFTREEAISIIEKEKGHKLDPGITDIFLKMVREGKIKD